MSNNTKVFFVPTPIGNLQDITLRAIEILKSVDLVYAEDTRKTLFLLNHLEIKKKLKSYHKDNEQNSSQKIIDDIENDNTIAIVSDAGTPCISDPGNILINKLLQSNIKFEVLPGATAFVPALLYSGFPTENFYFKGFLPHKKNKRIEEIDNIKKINSTIILYESPHRIKETLDILINYFPLPIAIVREITKIYEETIFINTKSDIKNITEKGEFVILLNNFIKNIDDTDKYKFKEIIKSLNKENFTNKEILKILKALGLKRNEAYKLIEE